MKTKDYPLITFEQLESITLEKCPHCGNPFSEDEKPELTPKCCRGNAIVAYWQGYLYIRCAECDKPVGRVEVASNTGGFSA